MTCSHKNECEIIRVYTIDVRVYRCIELVYRGKDTSNQNLICFVHYFKIINTVLKSDICILNKIV